MIHTYACLTGLSLCRVLAEIWQHPNPASSHSQADQRGKHEMKRGRSCQAPGMQNLPILLHDPASLSFEATM